MVALRRMTALSLLLMLFIIVFTFFILSSTKREYEALWIAYNASNQLSRYSNSVKETVKLTEEIKNQKNMEQQVIQSGGNYKISGTFSYIDGVNINGLIERVSTPASSRSSLKEDIVINGVTFKTSAVIDWLGVSIKIIDFPKSAFPKQGQGKDATLSAQHSLMETIPIQLYQLDGSTKESSLLVRKELAGDFKAAMDDLYNIKFPINSASVHNDRWGRSEDTLGHPNGIAIDINPTQNDFYQSAYAVNRWSSSESPYKINQQVIDIMASHGFTWGVFNSSGTLVDAMHFSADGW